MKKFLYIALGIAVIVAAGLFLTKEKKGVAELPLPALYAYNVDTVKASTKTVRATRHFLAQLLASKSALIASRFSAEIKKIHVKENDIVKKGANLISLDDAEIRANIASLQQQMKALHIDVANTKESLDRNQKLLAADAISREKFDNVNVLYQKKISELESTSEKINQLNAQLKYFNIKAPFSGRVGTIYFDAGNLAVPGKPIISLNSDDQKLLFSYVETAQPIMQGQQVLIDEEVVGSVIRLYDDAKNAMLIAEVKPSKPLAYANKSYVNIKVVVAEAKGCSMPLNALIHRKSGTVVMAYEEGGFHPMKVDVILQDEKEAILSVCPTSPVATGSEAKLALLPAHSSFELTEEK
ncbi:MAG: efflux RND transporter periplasmic adaptor subunit [Helicobacteraceae bacterium]|jgi:multidrug efflux pump subunit AcrA (membrane-fusion protein)|nr:efflux RND transporter periplasmic adaptor subunit [Helicobacteraceae bacterium]